MTDVDVIRAGMTIETLGLAKQGQPEIFVRVNNKDLLDEADGLIKFILAYVGQPGVTLRSGETMAYGYWLIKFMELAPGVLEIWEYNPNATEFMSGASLTLQYWSGQHAECDVLDLPFSPPRPDRLAAISEGVLEGESLEGVRYPAPEHMSGWYLTTDRYDGRVESLRVEHLYHVTAANPAIARYLALPPGGRFRISRDKCGAWFDEQVAKAQ